MCSIKNDVQHDSMECACVLHPNIRWFLFHTLLLAPVHEIDGAGGTGDGGVEPAEVVGTKHVVGHEALIDEDVGPLTSLCLVAGDGIGVLDLECIEVWVLLHSLDAFSFCGFTPYGK